MHKCKSLAALFLTVTMILVFAVPVFAAENRASEYIETYKVNIDKSENTVNLRVYISGAICASPQKIGVQTIVIQESTNGYSGWRTMDTLTSSANPTFMSSGTRYNETLDVYNGTSGMWYRCIVTIYAGGTYSGDSRTETTSAVQI